MHQTPAAAIEYLAGQLPTPPSDGLRRMVTDLMATGLPLGFERLQDSPVGSASLRRDGIVISLADVPLNEGVVGHELAAALLETKGWPCFFAGEAPDMWVGRIQKSLSSLLDNACGIKLQREYGIDADAYETFLLQREEQGLQQLLVKSSILNTMDMTAEQEIEAGIRIALMSIERFWRTGAVPADYVNAMDLFPGSKSLFTTLSDLAPEGVPMQGWTARFLMGQIVALLDDYMEIKGGIRPLMILSHFVPAVHADDADQPLADMARIVMVPLQSETVGEHSLFILPRRDGLPFGFRPAFADDAAKQSFVERLVRAKYGDFCRTLVPEDFLFWQPEGPSELAAWPADESVQA
jgi:hypothetical protein